MPDRPLPRSRTRAAAAALCAVAFALACGSDTPAQPDPNVRPAEQLHFLRPAADAPPLANTEVRFYAKRGTDREVALWYRPRPGQRDSSEFVRFKVPGAALESRPDGSRVAQGDSVLITVRVSDPSRLILEFRPSGLRFSAAAPARLKIRFADASKDLDGDGDEDASDHAAEQQLAIWRQEAAGLPWVRLTSKLEVETEQIEADLLGFSGYAIAF
ncbi:MAG: hypothetical protein ACYC3Q_04090 [Gemmatimonadaceae bacterium]